jgi:hypothetical protein
MKRLFALSEQVKRAGIKVVLVQIDEAHSSGWPMALDEQPEPQSNFQERVDRATQFVERYEPPYDVYIDGWDNQFAETFRAWPDKYHAVDNKLRVFAKAEYGTGHDGHQEAVVIEDYCDLLEMLINRTDD